MARRRQPRSLSPWDALTIGMKTWQNATLWGEMLAASALTIGFRSTGLARGLLDPRLADPAEGMRMVSEKMGAAAESSRSGSTSLARLQRTATAAWFEQWRNWQVLQANAARAFLFPYRWPQPLAMTSWTSLMSQALGANSRAMRPYHRRSTANARRLGRSG